MLLSPPGLEPTVAALAGSPAPRCRWAYLLRPFATPGAQALNNSWPESSVPGPPLKLLPGVPSGSYRLCGLWARCTHLVGIASRSVGQVYPSGSYRLCGLWARCTHLVPIDFVDCGPGVPIWFLSPLWTVGQVYPSGGYRFTVCGPGVNHLVGVTFVVCAPGVPSCWCQIHGLCTRCNPPWWCQIRGSLVSFFFACLAGFMSELARWCWKSVSSPSPSSFPAFIFCRNLTCSHRSVQENTPCTSDRLHIDFSPSQITSRSLLDVPRPRYSKT